MILEAPYPNILKKWQLVRDLSRIKIRCCWPLVMHLGHVQIQLQSILFSCLMEGSNYNTWTVHLHVSFAGTCWQSLLFKAQNPANGEQNWSKIKMDIFAKCT